MRTGLKPILMCNSISRRQVRPGSIRSRYGFRSCRGSRGGTSFTSLKQLQEHIDAYVDAYNEKAEPFVWTKKKVHQRPFKGRRITQLPGTSPCGPGRRFLTKVRSRERE